MTRHDTHQTARVRDVKEQLIDFLERHEERLAPYRDGLPSVLNKDQLYPPQPRLNGTETDLLSLLSNRENFNKIRTYAHSEHVRSAPLQFHAQHVYRQYLAHQIPAALEEDITRLQEELREAMVGYRSEGSAGPTDFEGSWKRFAEADSTTIRIETWKSLLKLGEQIAPLLLQLAALKNRAARERGFRNHHDYSLYMLQLDSESLDTVFKKADRNSEAARQAMTREVESALTKKFKARPGSVAPFYYEHPLRVLLPWGPGTKTDQLSKRTLSVLKGFLKRLGIPIPASIQGMEPSSARVTTKDTDRLIGELATGLHLTSRGLFDEGSAPPLAQERSIEPSPILVNAVFWLLVNELIKSDGLSESLGAPPKVTTQLKTGIETCRTRERLIASRYASALFRFDREFYTHPDRNLEEVFWNNLHIGLGIKMRETTPAWAICPDRLSGDREWLIRGLGVLSGEHLEKGLPHSLNGETAFTNDHSRELIFNELIATARRRPWQDVLRTLTGDPLSTTPSA